MVYRVVIVSTSATELSNGHLTGVFLEELASAYYRFTEEGSDFDVIIASIRGGPVPIDELSLKEPYFTPHAKKFMHDHAAFGKLAHSIALEKIDWSTVDALYAPGGHGTCVDFVNCPALKNAIEKLYADGKVVAAVCHGPLCLVDCEIDGKPIVQGKKVTGFTDSEERAVQLHDVVPFLLESKFREQGALYENGPDWSSFVCVDGKLITGQNAQSSEAIAEAVVAALKG